MDNPDLTSTMQEMMAEMAAMRAELTDLKQRANGLIPPQIEQPVKPAMSTTRRKALRRLTGGLLAGVSMVGVAATLPEQAEAKIIARTGHTGAIISPASEPVIGDLPASSSYKWGLVALSGLPSRDLSIDAQNYQSNTAIVGYSSDTGVYGNGAYYGVYGNSNYFGVYGTSNGTGVYGYGGSYAGYFQGNVTINGQMNGAAKFFKIDHPLDPANKYLNHASIESSDMMNLYNGIVTLNDQGEDIVTMPDWFEVLNSDYRYVLTSIGVASPNLHIAQEITDFKFKIAGGLPGQKVSWMVTGIRQDAYAKAHPIKVEEDKNEKEKGLYMHPELFGQPAEKSVHPRPEAVK